MIPAYNEAALIGATLRSIRQAAAATGQPFELIVVNDNSTDATAAIAQREGARVVSVNLRKIAAVRNAGARAAGGEVWIFVDGDTVLPADTLRAALAALAGGAVGGGAMIAFDQPIRWSLRPMFHIWSVIERLGTVAAGCFIFVHRADFEAVGGFDERYYVSEELHLSAALKRRGRFVILRQRVITSGRKARLYTVGQLLVMVLRMLWKGPRGWRRRAGLDFWYGGRREPE